MDARLLLPFLEEQNLLTPDQSREIADEQSRSGKPVEAVLANFGILQIPQILEKISDSLGLPMIPDLTGVEFSPELLSKIPPHTARNLGALPVATDGMTLTVALIDPLSPRPSKTCALPPGWRWSRSSPLQTRCNPWWSATTGRRKPISRN